MANLPNMGLKQSVIGTTLDPQWSQNHEDNFQLIDNHDHITIGKKITTEALDIDDSLSMQGNNIIDLRSPIFQNLSIDPSEPTDLCSLYFKNGNLWLNNGSGGHVQVSNGAGLNISTGTANLFTPKHVSTSTTILNTDDYTYIEVETNTSINLFLPAASTVAGNRFYYVKDVTGLSGTNAITLVPTGGNKIDQFTSNYVLKRNFGSWLVVSDGVSNWYVSQFSNKEINDGTWNSVGNSMVIDAKANGFTLKNNNASGALILTSGGNISINQPTTINSDVTFSSVSSTVTSFANVDFRNNTILGSSSSDSLTTNATALFNATTTFAQNVVAQSDIDISGSLSVGNNSSDILDVNATANFDADVTIGDSITDALLVKATSTFNENATFIKDVDIRGSASIGDSSSDILDINSTTNFDSNVTIGDSGSDTLTVNSSASFLSLLSAVAVSITGSSSLSGRVTASGAGRITKRFVNNATTGSYGPNTVELIRVSSGSPTITISDTNAVDGDIIEVSNQGVGTVVFNNPAASTLTTLAGSESAKAVRDGGSWVLFAKYSP